MPAPSLGGWGGLLRRPAFALLLTAALLLGAAGPRVPAAHATTQPLAAVLDPFPEQHSAGHSAQDIVTVLQSAGFSVTLFTGTDVTVDLMRHLTRYSVIYLYTHSGPLPNEDAAVSTGDTRHSRYAKYFKNYSLVTMKIRYAADSPYQHFDAITGRFLTHYSGRFLPHSLVFLNACTALGMSLFWKDLKKMGVGTLVSWQHHVTTADADRAAEDFFTDLAKGQSVSDSIAALQSSGEAVSDANPDKVGTLGFAGQGADSFQLMGAVAPSTTNRVGGVIADPAPHTTRHAGPHRAVHTNVSASKRATRLR